MMRKIKIGYLILMLLFLLFPLTNAETTFYDNFDDAIIFQNTPPTSTPSTTSSQIGDSGGGGCLTNWTCSSWNVCISNIQTRNCTKIKTYCYAGIKPNEAQSCTAFLPPENEEKPEEKVDNLFVSFIITLVIVGFITLLLKRKNKK